ncbi:MAG TPA: hypothetical protein VFE05_19775 [Longimicrobiaceae bacterium]|jgi:hypothetical protein|nr:hypothetical protein [Longimicrobiaceae bacterium]
MDDGREERAFARVIWELRAYLPEVVVIGGWVPYLYRQYGGFRRWAASVSFTADVDILIERPVPADGRRPIAEILSGAGFEPHDASAAVWIGDVARGEKVEFLVPHMGTARGLGRPVAVGDQRHLGAIPLQHLRVMRRHTTTLAVPAGLASGRLAEVQVTVPRLGAYVVNKASTFTHRGSGAAEGNAKRAKDLLYLRDLMAAGEEVATRIEADLAEISASHRETRSDVGYAASQLELALRGAASRTVDEAAEALAERERTLGTAAARADLQGHLTDLAEMLRANSR